jgi:Zn-dependent M28 family amino/carboxypeptidase
MKHKKTVLLYSIVGFFTMVVLLICFGIGYATQCADTWEGTTIEDTSRIDKFAIKAELKADVAFLADTLGPRNFLAYEQLNQCRKWIKQKWQFQGYNINEQIFDMDGKKYSNIEVEIKGKILPDDIIILSQQYDTLPDSPGANNNASGVAVLFQITKLLKEFVPDKTLRFVAFTNEEDPLFGTEKMGSYHYAKRSFERGENINVMLSLDAIGYYTEKAGSQRLPWPFSIFYPDVGNFLAFIGDFSSRSYLKAITRGFKKGSSFPIEAGVVPQWIEGASWSDHQSFWIFEYPAIMVTDTGAFRSPYHTTKEDTIDKMDFNALTRIVIGMYGVILEIA